MFEEVLNQVKQKQPLVHCITNYVTANDVANVLLAMGASPIMADDPMEAREITERCDALTLNLGTLDRRTVQAMLTAGERANELGHPVVLDPVGAGASRLRRETARQILSQIRVDVIRGNASEIRALALDAPSTRGVDAAGEDRIGETDLETGIGLARDYARTCGSIVVITGAVDLVCDDRRCFILRNGHPMMSRITGAGCQLTALTAAAVASGGADPLRAAAGAVALFGLAGEIAHARLESKEGTSAYRSRLIDAVSLMTAKDLQEGVRYEIYS